MNPILSGNGEIELLTDNTKVVAVDGLEQWQVDQLLNPDMSDSSSYSSNCLMQVDYVVTEWIHSLTSEQWAKIKRQQSLFGIPLPEQWVKVWRFILKEPQLRDTDRATKSGRAIGSYTHLWNMWSEECIDKYLDDLDKELLAMVDGGYLYSEIGDTLLGQYGDEFWKPRKAGSKTTPSQVVNNYLYWKLPNKIVRGELTSLVLSKIKNLKKKQEK